MDKSLPDLDCSINVFEGIRSEDIDYILKEYFELIDVHKYCCFIWRLFDLAYCDNYNISCEEDIDIVDRAIELELAHYYDGGRPTALDSIYIKVL